MPAISSPFQGTYPTGGIPEIGIDVPAAAVLLAVYLGLGIFHGYCFFGLSKRSFKPQAMVMGFCFSRVATMALRIAWAANVTNKKVAIASSVFLSAGVLLLFVANLIFLHRFILQLFPSIPTRESYPVNLISYLYAVSVVPLLILVIVPGIQLYLSNDLNTISADRSIIRFAQCYLIVFLSVQVILVTLVTILYFRRPNRTAAAPLEVKEVITRGGIIFVVASLLLWIQATKVCQAFYTPSRNTAVDPPWFLRREVIYAGSFLPELLCVIIYAAANIRTRFAKPTRNEGLVQKEESIPNEGKVVENV